MNCDATPLLPSRAAGLLGVLLCAALSACVQVEPREPAAMSVPPVLPVVVQAPPPPPDEVGPVLRYHQSLRRMTQGELLKELSGLSLQQRSPRVVMQMGMVLMLTRGGGDMARAQGLFDSVAISNDSEAAVFKPLAQVLASSCAEARRLSDQIDRLAGQQRDNLRRIDQLNDMVEGLKTIERTLPSRPAASMAQPVVK